MDTKSRKWGKIGIISLWLALFVLVQGIIFSGVKLEFTDRMYRLGEWYNTVVYKGADEVLDKYLAPMVPEGSAPYKGTIAGYNYDYYTCNGVLTIVGINSFRDSGKYLSNDIGMKAYVEYNKAITEIEEEINNNDYYFQFNSAYNFKELLESPTQLTNDSMLYTTLTIFCSIGSAMAIAGLFIIYLKKKRCADGSAAVVISKYDKIPLLVQLIFMGITVFFTFFAVFVLSKFITYGMSQITNSVVFLTLDWVCIVLAPMLAAFFAVRFVISIIRQIQARIFVKNLLTHRLVKVYKKFIYKKPLMIRMIILSAVFVIIEIILMAIINAGFDVFNHMSGADNALAYAIGSSIRTMYTCFALMILTSIGYVIIILKMVRSVQKLSDGISLMKKNEQPESNTIRQYEPLKQTYDELISLNDVIRKSIAEAVNSEHVKIELLTNVSYDLKTPLTSIISYIDLLSKTELSDEARDYVSVLQRKSERLSGMVCDVFELSKVNSGEVPVEIEKLDMTKLLRQTLGDMADKIDASGYIVKEIIPDQQLYINADGKRLYRVFQNLIDNALKYSLKGSRIFVELQQNEHAARLVVTNTSAYQIEFTAEEMKERFTRGDKSRSSEGSGLGLSIADSFVKACGGEFEIATDADQFRAIVKFETI